MSDREVRIISVSEVKPYEQNPRNNAEAVKYVARSIEAYGFKQPIVVDKDNVIIAGHTRWLAAKSIGMKDIPAIIADDLSEEEVKQYRLVDNKVAELSTWDFGLLEEELADIDIDMSLFGFENMSNDDDPEVEDDEFSESDDIPKRAKTGDIYILGRHRLMCGDSTKEKDIQTLMNGEKADLYLTDPPYNVNYEGKTKNELKIQNDNQEDDSFFEFLQDAFRAVDTVLKPGGAFYIWHAGLNGRVFTLALDKIGWEIRQILIWNKNHFTFGRQDYQWKHEPCLYGWKSGDAHYFTNSRVETTVIEDKVDVRKMAKAELINYIKELRQAIDYQTTILNADKPLVNAFHPTMKPVELMGYLIKNSSREGENVLDSFGGSGSTLIACEQLNRTCYMMELDPHYCDVIIARWEKFTGETAKKL